MIRWFVYPRGIIAYIDIGRHIQPYAKGTMWDTNSLRHTSRLACPRLACPGTMRPGSNFHQSLHPLGGNISSLNPLFFWLKPCMDIQRPEAFGRSTSRRLSTVWVECSRVSLQLLRGVQTPACHLCRSNPWKGRPTWSILETVDHAGWRGALNPLTEFSGETTCTWNYLLSWLSALPSARRMPLFLICIIAWDFLFTDLSDLVISQDRRTPKSSSLLSKSFLQRYIPVWSQNLLQPQVLPQPNGRCSKWRWFPPISPRNHFVKGISVGK